MEANYSKKYYEKNKDKILAKEKETKRWLSYYERNKELVRERNLARYYTKQGRERPPPKQPPPPPDNSKIEKLEALVAELRELVPQVMKPKKVKKIVAPIPVTTPVTIPEEVKTPAPV
jgi:hypothetical protein